MKTALQTGINEMAKIFLRLEVGEKIPTVSELNEKLGLGFGTVQKALTTLQAAQAVKTRAHGHKGTYILDADPIKLWEFTGNAALRIVLPFPNSSEFQGLADGLRLALDELDLRSRLDYHTGAADRIESVRSGDYDACIVSGIVVDEISSDPTLECHFLDPTFYYPPKSLLLLTSNSYEDNGTCRVAVDRSSIDHNRLTLAEFGADPKVEFVECRSRDFINCLMRGEADRLVWHRVNIGVALDLLPLTASSLQTEEVRSLSSVSSRAAFVVRRDRRDLCKLLASIDKNIIYKEQERALEIPS